MVLVKRGCKWSSCTPAFLDVHTCYKLWVLPACFGSLLLANAPKRQHPEATWLGSTLRDRRWRMVPQWREVSWTRQSGSEGRGFESQAIKNLSLDQFGIQNFSSCGYLEWHVRLCWKFFLSSAPIVFCCWWGGWPECSSQWKQTIREGMAMMKSIRSAKKLNSFLKTQGLNIINGRNPTFKGIKGVYYWKYPTSNLTLKYGIWH